jgi:hypothetical protein
VRFSDPQCDIRLVVSLYCVITPISLKGAIIPKGGPVALALIIDLQIQRGALESREFNVYDLVE